MKKSKLALKCLFIFSIASIVIFFIELINKKCNIFFLLYGIGLWLIAIGIKSNF